MARVNLWEFGEKWSCPFVARQEIRVFTGGAVSEKTMANLDSQGEGPEGRFRIGRKVLYPVENLIKWLEARCLTEDNG